MPGCVGREVDAFLSDVRAHAGVVDAPRRFTGAHVVAQNAGPAQLDRRSRRVSGGRATVHCARPVVSSSPARSIARGAPAIAACSQHQSRIERDGKTTGRGEESRRVGQLEDRDALDPAGRGSELDRQPAAALDLARRRRQSGSLRAEHARQQRTRAPRTTTIQIADSCSRLLVRSASWRWSSIGGGVRWAHIIAARRARLARIKLTPHLVSLSKPPLVSLLIGAAVSIGAACRRSTGRAGSADDARSPARRRAKATSSRACAVSPTKESERARGTSRRTGPSSCSRASANRATPSTRSTCSISSSGETRRISPGIGQDHLLVRALGDRRDPVRFDASRSALARPAARGARAARLGPRAPLRLGLRPRDGALRRRREDARRCGGSPTPAATTPKRASRPTGSGSRSRRRAAATNPGAAPMRSAPSSSRPIPPSSARSTSCRPKAASRGG